MQSSVAVVILNWNGKKHLQEFLPSVVEHSKNATIYLADNASSDDSIAYVKENFPEVNIIVNEKNWGFAEGYNQALANLDEDYFVLLNSDVEVTPNWIAPIVESMEKTNDIVIAQPKIKSYREKEMFEYAGAAGGFIDKLGYPFCRGRIFSEIEKDEGQYDNDCEIFWATGACMFIKSSIFKQFEGFDKTYFAHMEEIDLCWRVKNQGYKIYYYSGSTVYHLGGGTMQNSNPRKTFLNFRNSLLTLYKNDQSSYTILKIIIRLKLDALAFILLLFNSGIVHAIAIFKAHFAFYFASKNRFKAQKLNQSGMLNRSIVFSHYVLRKKKFTQLKYGSN